MVGYTTLVLVRKCRTRAVSGLRPSALVAVDHTERAAETLSSHARSAPRSSVAAISRSALPPLSSVPASTSK